MAKQDTAEDTMRRLLVMTAPVVLSVVLAGFGQAVADPQTAKVQSASGFDRLKSLVHGGTDMVTIYCPDGDRMMMTHYCADNNQPRMRAEPVQGDVKEMAFSFVDATNLEGPSDGHMHRLVLSFQDSGHFTQEWTYRQGDKDEREVFRFER